MGFSPLADMSRRITDGGRCNPRGIAVTGMGLHHNAGVDAYSEAWNPNREVSANYWITNDGVIIPNVDESLRAWTSGMAGYPAGAQADHRNITVEISNSPEGVRNGTWAISGAALNALIRLIADVWQRYGLGLVQRSATHGLGVHQDWVPTSCPGPYIMGNLGHIINAANQIISGVAPEPEPKEEEEDMNTYFEATANSSPVKAGDPGSSRIWAGADRVINGAKYSGVWERSADGSVRRLFSGEWAGIVAAHEAAGRKLPLAKVHGNVIEQMYLVERAAPRR